jgi:hypothetical protein
VGCSNRWLYNRESGNPTKAAILSATNPVSEEELHTEKLTKLRMNQFRKILLSLLALAVVAAMLFYWQHRRHSFAGSNVAVSRPEKVVRVAEWLGVKPGTERDETPRAKNLKRLKKMWMELEREDENSGIVTEQHRALAKESVDLLLCSKEMIELIHFLERNKATGYIHLKGKVEELFRSSRASEARDILVDLQEDEKYPFRQDWSFDAGLGCPEEEFESFCESLRDPSAVKNAIFGRSMALMTSDPVAAISMAFEALRDDVPSIDKPQGLERLFKVLPVGTDFEELEALLPPDSSLGCSKRMGNFLRIFRKS